MLQSFYLVYETFNMKLLVHAARQSMWWLAVLGAHASVMMRTGIA